MANSGSYARGNQPRSVADPDAAAYEAAMRRQRAYNARQDAALDHQSASARNQAEWWRQHPGMVESFVPVWGSAREAVADAAEGDVAGAAFNGLLAASDLLPGTFVVKSIAKGGAKMAGSHTWNATRKWMGKQGMLDLGQHGHHGIIPQRGWGKLVPDAIKNQPWNITAMPSRQVYGRIHGPYAGQPQYAPLERYWRGSPNWAKAAHGWLPAGAATAVDSHVERK